MQDIPTDPVPPAPRPRRGRRTLRTALLLLALVIVPAGALWLRLGAAPLRLPDAVAARIEARIDAGMTMNDVSLGAVVLSRPAGAILPVLEFRDVALTDPGGAPRAALPALRVRLAPGALLAGQVRPARVEVAGAELRLSRDAAGSFDVAFTGAGARADLTLADTLARLDAMVSAPAFAELQAVVGTGLSVVLEDAMTGQVIRLREAEARLARRDGGLGLDLSGALIGSRDARLAITLTRRAAAGDIAVSLAFEGLAARDLATAAPALSWLDLMRAPISGQLGLRLADDGTVEGFDADLAIGAGRLTLAPETAPLPFDAMTAALSYDPETRRLAFGRLALDAPALAFEAAGHADVSADANRFTAQLHLSDITAAPEGLYPEPLHLDGATVDLRLTLAPVLTLELGQAAIHDGDLRLDARGRLEAQDDGLALSFDAGLAAADLATVLAYWPESAAARTRAWLAGNVAEAGFSSVDFALRRAPGAAPVSVVQFDFSGAEIRALPEAPPIRAAAGYLNLEDNALVMRLDAGQVAAPGGGDLDLGGSVLQIGDVRPRGPEARFDLRLAGPLDAALRLLQGPPFALFRDGAVDPAHLGTGALSMDLGFTTRLLAPDPQADPAARFADLGMAGRGRVTGWQAPDLVPGRPLAAERLDLTLEPGMIAVAGRARFDGVAVSGTWRRAIGPEVDGARLEGRAPLDAATLARFGAALPEGMLTGRGEAGVVLDLPDGGVPRLTLDSDLAGVALAIPQLGWRLPPERTGRARAEIRLGPGPAVTGLEIDAGGLTLVGAVTLAPGGGFGRLSASRFRLEDWLDVTGALVGQGGDQPPLVEVTGGALDMRRAPGITPGSGGPSGPLSIALDRLQVSDGIALTGVSADLVASGGLSGRFRGQVNGAVPVTGDLVPGPAGTSVRLTAADGGAVLRAAGVYRSLYGGEMLLVLQATGETGTYRGRLDIEGPRLRDAPAMAELLNLISIVGLLEQLGGEGINLGDVEARFRLSPSEIRLTEGTALGPSMGLSMDGVYRIDSRALDMQGVVSPLYMVNGLIGALFAPRREGLFGFAYRVTGTADSTNVAVNPLSILTPGVFREIFRRPPPDLTDLPGAPP